MFKCQAKGCNARGEKYEAPVKRVTETRKKTYENVISRGKKKFTVRSEGSEIVSEIAVCSKCAEKLPA